MSNTSLSSIIKYHEVFEKPQKRVMREPVLLREFLKICLQPDMRKWTINIIASNILKVIQATRNVLHQDEYFKIITTPHKIFEWSMTHFKKRMDPNIKYIDVLRLEPPNSLGISKMLTDLDNLEWLLKMAISEPALAVSTLKGCQMLLSIREDLDMQYKVNERILMLYQNKIVNFEEYEKEKMNEMVLKINQEIDNCMDEELVSLPIHHRYMRNTYLIQIKEFEFCLNHKSEETERRNENYHETTTQNYEIYDKIMDYYFIINQELRYQIDSWAERYDEDYDKIENEVIYKTLAIRALKKEWNDSIDRLAWYREEKLRMANEEIQAENERQLAIEAEAARKLELEQSKQLQKKQRRQKKLSK